MNLRKCQIFTPKNIVDLMLDRVGYKEKIWGKKIVDNSCGNGNFLVEILHRFIKEGKNKKVSEVQIKSKIEKCIYGYEIDTKQYIECINKMKSVAEQYGIHNVNWNIHCADGLKIDGDDEFDFVVGNPPYVAYRDLTKKEREDTRDGFISCKKGKFDYSYAFIEKGIKLLKPNGKMIMISPLNMFKTVFGRKLREFIKPHLISVIDCGKDNIFSKVLISPSITIYQKESAMKNIEYQIGLDGQICYVVKEKLKDKWVFNEQKKGVKRFGDYFRVSNSIATLLNKVFIHNVDDIGCVNINNVCIESEIMRVAKSPRSEKYNIKQKIIFPYMYSNGELQHMDETVLKTKYPNTYEYLSQKKIELEKRDSDSNAKWFEYGRSQALAHLNQKKLMMSSIVTNEVVVYELGKEEIPYSGFYIVSKGNKTLQDAKKILKSDEFYKYLSEIGISVNGESIRISSKDIENYKFEE